jgi:hypothetical protein
MYSIRIDYRTGDSFHTEDTSECLDGTWKDINIVAKNLERIKEHYEWYQEENSGYRRHPKNTIPRPEYVDPKYDCSFQLLLDDGTEYPISAFWCGYFETLYGASVELKMGFRR